MKKSYPPMDFTALIKKVRQWHNECQTGTIQCIVNFGQNLVGLQTEMGAGPFRQLTEHNADSTNEQNHFPVRYQVARNYMKIAECSWITEHPERWPRLPSDHSSLAAIAKMHTDEIRDAALFEHVINPEVTSKAISAFRKKPKTKPTPGSSKHPYIFNTSIRYLTAKEAKDFKGQINLVAQDFRRTRPDVEYKITCVKVTEQSGRYTPSITVENVNAQDVET